MEITLQMKKLNKVTIERRKIEFNKEKHFDYSKYHIRYTKKNHSHPKEVVSISNINIIRCIVVLNENEFKIPCIGGALPHDDVSSTSGGQESIISMILSFLSQELSTEKINLPLNSHSFTS